MITEGVLTSLIIKKGKGKEVVDALLRQKEADDGRACKVIIVVEPY